MCLFKGIGSGPWPTTGGLSIKKEGVDSYLSCHITGYSITDTHVIVHANDVLVFGRMGYATQPRSDSYRSGGSSGKRYLGTRAPL